MTNPETGLRVLSPAQLQQRRTAAVKSGVFARSKPNLERRSYRAVRLYADLKKHMDIDPTEVATARAWCELEILARDAFDLTQADPTNEKAFDRYAHARRLQLAYARELGLTPTTRLEDLSAASRQRGYRR